jgi:hypothetical protein
LNQPILDMWGFRPAQTAISVQYMLQGIGWFANIVPVFGEPWVVALEFPLYQWCVTLAAWMTGAPLDACGRLVNASFTIAVLWPIWLLAKDTMGARGRRAALLLGGIWLLSPVVVFWGRSFLIETTSVFLAACWLAFYVRFLKNRRPATYLACVVFGMLAATVKATTFAGFAVAGLFFSGAYLWNARRDLRRQFLPLLIAGSSTILAAAALVAWNRYAGIFAQQNPMANQITASSIPGWYFGTWDDRVSSTLWNWAIRQRELPEALGRAWYVLGGAIACLLLLNIRYAILAILSSIAYLSVYIFFPKLHMFNGYYQPENVIFLCAAVVLVFEGFSRRNNVIFAHCFLFVVVLSQMSGVYGKPYGPLLFDDLRKHPYYQTGLMLKDMTQPDSVIVVFGTGYGADVPYYAERRGIAVANWYQPALLHRLLFEERDHWFGNRKLGAVVDCAVFENQRVEAVLQPILDDLKRELDGRAIEVPGSFYGSSVNPPKCTIYLPHGR